MSAHRQSRPKAVPLGVVIETSTVRAAVAPAEIRAALRRHQHGDWGEAWPEERALNDVAQLERLRVFSIYRTRAGREFWIITEPDRSYTTVLLPSDY